MKNLRSFSTSEIFFVTHQIFFTIIIVKMLLTFREKIVTLQSLSYHTCTGMKMYNIKHRFYSQMSVSSMQQLPDCLLFIVNIE